MNITSMINIGKHLYTTIVFPFIDNISIASEMRTLTFIYFNLLIRDIMYCYEPIEGHVIRLEKRDGYQER